MAHLQKRTGWVAATGLSFVLATLAVGSILTGDVQLRFAGVDVKVKNHADRGLVINIEGAECPGKDCPVIALDWKAGRKG